jgi:hypothetical protein
MEEVVSLDYDQYSWAQDTGSQVVIRQDGHLIAFSDGDAIILKHPDGEAALGLVGLSNKGTDYHLAYDMKGNAIGDTELLGQHRLRTGFNLDAPLAALRSASGSFRSLAGERL